MSADAGLPRVEARPLAAPGSLAAGLLSGDPSVAGLLPGPGPDEAAESRARQCRLPAEAFRAASPSARDKLARVLAGDGVVVSTGQQPALFLGPMYVVYKTLTAVAHAGRIEAASGRTAVACFWVASDDHDWEEVATAKALDREDEVRSFTIAPPPGRDGSAVGPTALPPRIADVLAEFVAVIGRTELSDEAFRPLRAAYAPGATFAGAFADGLADLFAGLDLVILDASRPEVKAASVPLLRRCLEDAAGCAVAFDEGTRRIAEAGYEPRLHPPAGGTQVFHEAERREHLVRGEDGRLGTRGGESGPLPAWLERLDASPERFSAGAALRPALESWLLPIARTVLGPGELEYWAQLGPLFERLDVPVPGTAPRASWTLVEPRVERWLKKLGTSSAELADGGEAVARGIVAGHRPRSVDEALRSLRAAVSRDFESVEAAAGEELPGIRSAVGKSRKAVFDALRELEGTIDARVREREETLVGQARRASAHLYPGGRPQERVVGPWPFLARYGPAFLSTLVAAHGLAARRAP